MSLGENVQADYAAEWRRCRPWIEAAVDRTGGTHTIEDVERGLAEGKYQFWPGARSAAITAIHEYPRAKWLSVFLAGGDLYELVDMVPVWRHFAAFNGCSNLSITGRRGWERVLSKHGWAARAVCLSLPIAESGE